MNQESFQRPLRDISTDMGTMQVLLLGHGGFQVGVMGVVPSMMECKEQKIDMLVVMSNQGGSRDQWSISSERVELKLEYSELEMRVLFSSLGVTTHCSLATLVEKEYWGLVQSSTEVPEGAT